MDCCKESFNSANSSLYTAVSTTSKKTGLVFGFVDVAGKMYSIVEKSVMSSAGRVYSEILEA